MLMCVQHLLGHQPHWHAGLQLKPCASRWPACLAESDSADAETGCVLQRRATQGASERFVLHIDTAPTNTACIALRPLWLCFSWLLITRLAYAYATSLSCRLQPAPEQHAFYARLP